MDNILNYDFLKVATPIVGGLTYLSAFKNGKPTCDRFLVNNFLYLLITLMIYITSIKYYEKENINLSKESTGTKIGVFILSIVVLMGMFYVNNIFLKHLLLVLFLLLIGYISKESMEKYDKELIKETVLKVTLIVLGCVAFSLAFPNFIKPSMANILIIGLLVAIIFRIVDSLVLGKKYHNYISYLIIFIFTAFLIYDTDRVRKVGQLCKKTGKPEYIENMLDMFLNIINLFSTIAGLED